MMIMKNKDIDSLIEENERLLAENERLKEAESYCFDLMNRCEELEDRLRESITLARQAQANFAMLYKELLKLKQ